MRESGDSGVSLFVLGIAHSILVGKTNGCTSRQYSAMVLLYSGFFDPRNFRPITIPCGPAQTVEGIKSSISAAFLTRVINPICEI